jgi:hypothetical protein
MTSVSGLDYTSTASNERKAKNTDLKIIWKKTIVTYEVQYIPEDNSELHTRRRENLKSHIVT